jgi:hypothetical protein
MEEIDSGSIGMKQERADLTGALDPLHESCSRAISEENATAGIAVVGNPRQHVGPAYEHAANRARIDECRGDTQGV